MKKCLTGLMLVVPFAARTVASRAAQADDGVPANGKAPASAGACKGFVAQQPSGAMPARRGLA